MTDDILEQLAALEVEAPPAEFDRRLHDRVNRCLLWQQLLDLVLGALPWALLNFVRSVAGFTAFTATGRFADERKDKKKPDGL
jgi:hypothetical protein